MQGRRRKKNEETKEKSKPKKKVEGESTINLISI
jgi:hypothetical protein